MNNAPPHSQRQTVFAAVFTFDRQPPRGFFPHGFCIPGAPYIPLSLFWFAFFFSERHLWITLRVTHSKATSKAFDMFSDKIKSKTR